MPRHNRRNEKPKPGADDLRGYLAHAHLASIRRNETSHPYALPPRGDRSARPGVTIRANPQRNKIRHIWKYEKDAFNKTVRAFHKRCVYDDKCGPPYLSALYTVRPPTEALSLPSDNHIAEKTVATNIPYPSTMQGTCKWLEAPFKTVQRAVHLAYPDTRRWWLDDTTDTNDEANREKWRSYVLRFHPDHIQPDYWQDTTDEHGEPKVRPMPHEMMSIVVQPPYSLSWQDLLNVADVKKTSNVSPTGARRKRVWAKLLDTCKRDGTHWFAITTYEGWLFGKFNDDWSIVHHSGVREYCDNDPNVIQTFVFWMASALECCGTGKMIPVLVPKSKAQKREEAEAEEQLTGPGPSRPSSG